MVITLVLGIILCIMFSAVFSAAEMAISSANKVRLEHEAEAGKKKAIKALYLTEHFDDTLSSILIGNNLVNIAASSMSSVLVILITGGSELTWLATLTITLIVIIFGETMPKIMAKRNATRFSLFLAPFLRVLTIILKPLVLITVSIISTMTRNIKTPKDDEDETVEELTNIIETAGDEGVLDDDQTELLINALDFRDISAYEVMTARVDIDAVDIEDSVEDIMEVIGNTPFTRLPVYEDSIDNVIGVLHLNDILKAFTVSKDVPIRSILMEPVFVYRTTKLPAVLKALRAAKQHMAIVTDEYSGTAGIITLEDVLEEIVGEIWDEYDIVEEEIIEKSEREFELDGDLNIYEFLELLDIDEDDYEYDSETVGGLVMELLERFPEEGDEVKFENSMLKVLEAGERRVEKVRLAIDEDTEEDKNGED